MKNINRLLVNSLSEKGAKDYLKEIIDGIYDNINNLDEEQVKEILNKFSIILDTLDEDDFFGTEGWHHYFLGED